MKTITSYCNSVDKLPVSCNQSTYYTLYFELFCQAANLSKINVQSIKKREVFFLATMSVGNSFTSNGAVPKVHAIYYNMRSVTTSRTSQLGGVKASSTINQRVWFPLSVMHSLNETMYMYINLSKYHYDFIMSKRTNAGSMDHIVSMFLKG